MDPTVPEEAGGVDAASHEPTPLPRDGGTSNEGSVTDAGTIPEAGPAMPDGGPPLKTCYPDEDGDGYPGPGTPTLAARCPVRTTTRATPADCDDRNGDAHPGQTATFGAPRASGSFDYDCDGRTTQVYTVGGSVRDTHEPDCTTKAAQEECERSYVFVSPTVMAMCGGSFPGTEGVFKHNMGVCKWVSGACRYCSSPTGFCGTNSFPGGAVSVECR